MLFIRVFRSDVDLIHEICSVVELQEILPGVDLLSEMLQFSLQLGDIPGAAGLAPSEPPAWTTPPKPTIMSKSIDIESVALHAEDVGGTVGA